MNKVLCDVCGTAFADTADQCPICGTAKSAASRPAPGSSGSDSGYAYVKGGRFSQSNVRKKNSSQPLPRESAEPQPRREQPARPSQDAPQPVRRERRQEPANEQPSNIGLIIVVVILLLAIISVCAYVGIRFIRMNNERKAEQDNSTGSGQVQNIPCEGLSVPGGMTSYTFDTLGQEWMVELKAEPSNTTELITWEHDANIVHVEQNGNYLTVTPVGIGETTVTVSCGDCTVTLTIHSELTEVPCKGITINGADSHTFTDFTPLELTVTCNPPSATDEITWAYDDTVISVQQQEDHWVVTPLCAGETALTVSCGGYTDTISIIAEVYADFVLEWAGRNDITLNGYDDKAQIYNGIVPVSAIEFIVEDSSIAEVIDGYVYARSNGKTAVTARYSDQVITMTVRVKNVDGQSGDSGQTGSGEYFLYTQYGKLSDYDITISVDESVNLSLRTADGTKITEGITFTVSDSSIIKINENGRVTGLSSGRAYAIITYQGVEIKCLIRVKSS